jgi:pyruvate formate lyase activating enzyme
LGALIGLTDLFIIDLKWADPTRHRELTGRALEEPMALIAQLEQMGRPYWIRQVLVPELNDGEDDLKALGCLLAGLGCCARFEFLPYHTLGRHKWEELGLAYSLAGRRAATEEDVARAMGLVKNV